MGRTEGCRVGVFCHLTVVESQRRRDRHPDGDRHAHAAYKAFWTSTNEEWDDSWSISFVQIGSQRS